MADIVGPSLDQLNNWGNTDQMRQEPLDSLFWTTVALREGESTALTTASISSNAIRIQFGDSILSTSASVVGAGIRIQISGASQSTQVDITAEGIRIQFGASLLVGPAIMTARGGLIVSATATPQTSVIIEAIATGEFVGASSLSSFVTFTETDVEILGEKWSIVSDEGESWNVVVESDDVWTVVSEGSEDWNEQ